MTYLWIILLLTTAFICTQTQDVVCKKGKTNVKVKIGNGESYSFKTQARGRYKSNTNCIVKYRKLSSCSNIRFSCPQFDIRNNNANCKRLDKMVIKSNGETMRFCQKNGPDITTAGDLKVSFFSNKKKQAAGATCKVECVDETTTTSTTATTTTTTTAKGSGHEETCGDYPEDHTMIVYPGPSEVCGDRRVFDGLTDEAKGWIVDAHNELRQKVAAGLEGNGSQPGATNMRKLVWNTELETVAQRWASQCNFGHDSERSKCDGTYVGQNAYYSAKGVFQRTAKDPVVMQNAVNAVHAWYGEVESPGFDNSNIDPFVFSYGAGHYTQVVWADTTEIGCGLTYYQDGTWAHGVWYKTLVVCNYAKGGNMQSGQMYEVGAGCSNCPSGTACDGTYSALCA